MLNVKTPIRSLKKPKHNSKSGLYDTKKLDLFDIFLYNTGTRKVWKGFLGVKEADGETSIKSPWYLKGLTKMSYGGDGPEFKPDWRGIVTLVLPIILNLILIYFIPVSAFGLPFLAGVNYTWTDNTSGNTLWSDQGNWNDGASGIPDDNGDTATFDATWTSNATADTGYTVGDITVANGYTGTITQTAAYIMDDAGAGSGTFTVADASATWDCNGNDFTSDAKTLVTTGTFDCGASTCQFGTALLTADWGLRVDGGTFTGGSGTHSIASIGFNGGTCTLSSGTTTVTSGLSNAGRFIGWFLNAPTFDDGDGTLVFNSTTLDQDVYENNNTARTLYNLTLNNTGQTVQWRGTRGADYTIANNFTITSGTWDTNEHDGTPGGDLTVTNLTSITGTLTCNASTISLGSGRVATTYALTVEDNGIFDGGSGTHTIGMMNADKSNNTVTFSSGATTFNGRQSVNFVAIALDSTTTFDDGNGELILAYAGDQLLFDQSGALTLYDFTINNGGNTVQWFNGGGANLTVANDFTITAGTFDTEETVSGTDKNLTVTNDLSIAAAGILTGNASTITVTGNISNANTFTAGTSTFVMDGTTQTLTGSWTFWHFTKSVAAADTLTFDNTATYTFGGNVTLNGASGQLLSIVSDAGGTAFNFTMSAGAVKTNLSFLSVTDSDASGSDSSHTPISPTDSVDGGGNTDWFGFAAGQACIIVVKR